MHGLTEKVTKHKPGTRVDCFRSRFLCHTHEACLAVPCAWPWQQLSQDWLHTSTCRSPLLKEATCCFKCGEPADYLCVYGGHMVCVGHVSDMKHQGSYKSRNTCCGPTWPNPFRSMYLGDSWEILELDTKTAHASYYDFTLRTEFPTQDVAVHSWLYLNDLYPQKELVSVYTKTKQIVAQRLALEPLTQSVSLSLQRCRNFWVTALLTNSLCHILARVTTPDSLYVHSSKFFMVFYYPLDDQVECVVCRQKQPRAVFETSNCCVYPLSELRPFLS